MTSIACKTLMNDPNERLAKAIQALLQVSAASLGLGGVRPTSAAAQAGESTGHLLANR
jgi:hypothetical protein